MPLGRNSKIEISFPSFMNMSGEKNRVSCQEKKSVDMEQKENFHQNYQFCIKISETEQERSQEKNESLIVTLDNIKIEAKKTTTPKRMLSGYGMNNRSATPKNLPQSNSKQSELSNGFNLTAQSFGTREKEYTENKLPTVTSQDSSHSKSSKNIHQPPISQPQNMKKQLSNSCGGQPKSKKRASFIRAILEQSR